MSVAARDITITLGDLTFEAVIVLKKGRKEHSLVPLL